MITLEITLPYLPPRELSPNWKPFTRGGLYVYKRVKDSMGNEVYYLAYQAMREAGVSEPLAGIRVQYTFICPTRRIRDADNWIGRMKVAQDALVKVELIKDDSHDIVEVARPVFKFEKGRAETIITIEEREA